MRIRWLALVFTIGLGIAQEPSREKSAALAPGAGDATVKAERATDAALIRALALEASHEWAKAREAYDEVLAQQPENADARSGKMRVSQVLVAELHYRKCLAEAERLAADASFQAAIRRYNEAMAVKPSYLPPDRHLPLRAALMAQNVPVEVTLKSDGHTWISIEYYRAPKKLERETVKILPGNYRLMGRREGYENVEQDLIVRAGAPFAVTVACSVPTAGSATMADDEQGERFEREYQQRLAARRADEAREKARFDEELAAIRREFPP